MDNDSTNKHFFIRFFNEIALYSGQYALFYILMQFCSEGNKFWLNEGHVALLTALLIQTAALVHYGDKIVPRIILSFLSLVVYTILELMEGGISYSLVHTGHLFFWIYTLIFAVLQYISFAAKRQNVRMIVEFLESNINMFIFIFIYFFFDLKLDLQKDVELGKISADFANHKLLIGHFSEGFSGLLNDPAHVYIILGTVFLSFTIAYGRIKILLLSEQIDTLLVRYIGEETRDKLIQRKSETNSMRIKTVILYCDIRDFTRLSEKADASDVVSMLNYYYGKWHETIKRFNGTINKFIGDALLAFFDSKASLSENTVFAVQSALSMLHQQATMNQELKAQGLPAVEAIGIGIHCGEVILGDIGGARKDYTLIGDTVNTAARLESLCKTHNTPLIISDACYVLLDDGLKKQFSKFSSIELKGKEECLTLYGLNHTSISPFA